MDELIDLSWQQEELEYREYERMLIHEAEEAYMLEQDAYLLEQEEMDEINYWIRHI